MCRYREGGKNMTAASSFVPETLKSTLLFWQEELNRSSIPFGVERCTRCTGVLFRRLALPCGVDHHESMKPAKQRKG